MYYVLWIKIFREVGEFDVFFVCVCVCVWSSILGLTKFYTTSPRYWMLSC